MKIIISHVIATTLLLYIIISPTIGSILHPPTPRTSSTRWRRDEVVRTMIVVIRSWPASLLTLLYVVQRLPTYLILDQHQSVDSPTTLRTEGIIWRRRLIHRTTDLHHSTFLTLGTRTQIRTRHMLDTFEMYPNCNRPKFSPIKFAMCLP